MAYRFASASSELVEFAIAPFNGNLLGAVTMAILLKRNTIANQAAFAITNSANTGRVEFGLRTGGAIRFSVGGVATAPLSGTWSSTSLFYLFAATWAGGGATPRFHIHDGTSWTHVDASSAGLSDLTVAGTDRLKVGSGTGGFLNADVVCCGIKKSSSADATVETLTQTTFASWAAFGFDWLIGFDTSKETAGILQDQASPGTGDEIAITGTTTATDPAGWSWAGGGGAAAFVPQVIVI